MYKCIFRLKTLKTKDSKVVGFEKGLRKRKEGLEKVSEESFQAQGSIESSPPLLGPKPSNLLP